MRYPFESEPLTYGYAALAPCIDATTLHFHHDKHYVNYINKLNDILKNYPNLQNMSLEDLLTKTNELPAEARTSILNNAGGVYNHELYFTCMNENNKELPTDQLAIAINGAFGSFSQFKAAFIGAALSQFGSGYAWLIISNDHLEVISTPNQDVPISENVMPVMCIDVWEHAYYLQYQHDRQKYVENWFSLIDWDFVAARYMSLISKIRE